MASFEALASYHFFTNFMVGVGYFMAVYGLGSWVVKSLPFSFSNSLCPALNTVTGFLTVSLIVQLMSFFFWINDTSLGGLTLFLGCTLSWQFYLFWKRPLPTFQIEKGTAIWMAGFVLCLLPLIVYAILPSTKIDELFYHQLVSQRIVVDGGMIFYRQPWEAAIPPHLLYNFSHLPLVYWGFPDAPNVVSVCVFGVLLLTLYRLFKQANVPSWWQWFSLSVACLGMYRLTFTTAGSHHFGDLAAFMGLYIFFAFFSLKQQMSVSAILVMQGIFLAAMAGAKMSLLPFAVLLGVAMLYELWQQNSFNSKRIVLFLLPTLIFYMPIVIWTYLQTNSPFGLMLSQYFDTKIIDSHLVASTMQAEIVNTPTFLEHVKTALFHFPYILLLSPFFFALSSHPKLIKVKILGISLAYLIILYTFDLLYHPRFWGNIPFTLLVLAVLGLPQNAFSQWRMIPKTVFLHRGIFALTLLPYLVVSYYYLYYLQPFPINESSKVAYYKKFIPLYEDYKVLDKRLPKDACLLTQNRLNLVHAPRRIFRDTLDVCHCQSIYAIQCDTLSLPVSFPIQHQIYTLYSLVYQNREALITIYRTPNKKPKTGTLSVYKLRPVVAQ